jgi:hypothetical protein
MRPELVIKIISVVFTITFMLTGAFAQESQDSCAQIRYSSRLTDSYRYRLRSLEGQAVYGEASDKGELQSASGVCLALFDPGDKHLVVNAKTEPGGQFRFAGVAPGKYVLILDVSALHPIIIPVELAGHPRGNAFREWDLLLHLRSKEDRKKSFVTPITQPALRRELLRRVREDQAIRDEMIRKGMVHPDKDVQARMTVIDSNNTARMKEIVSRYGWPGPALVGADGAGAAFMLVQHSPSLAFQKAMLPLVQKSYLAGKLSAWDYALLTDRVLMREGKPQLYGMAIKPWVGKEPELYPIEDEANVDKRRASIGLPPLREYLEGLKRQYFPQP